MKRPELHTIRWPDCSALLYQFLSNEMWWAWTILNHDPSTPWRLLYVPPGLIFKNSTWCSHWACVLCPELKTNSDFLPNTLADWFCTDGVKSVYCAVRIESLYTIQQKRLVFEGFLRNLQWHFYGWELKGKKEKLSSTYTQRCVTCYRCIKRLG
jgi:hypothetical protein